MEVLSLTIWVGGALRDMEVDRWWRLTAAGWSPIQSNVMEVVEQLYIFLFNRGKEPEGGRREERGGWSRLGPD